jgi:hypothetical protein
VAVAGEEEVVVVVVVLSTKVRAIAVNWIET